MKRTNNLLLSLVLIMILGCHEAAAPPGFGQKENSLNENFVEFDEDDQEMNPAIAKAKESFSYFKENWQTMDNDGYSLKFGLKTNDDSLEHIWFNPSKIEGTKITAECTNDPVNIPNLKIRDIRVLDQQQLSDWMIMQGNKCYGGYTVKVAFEQQAPAGTEPPFEFIDP